MRNGLKRMRCFGWRLVGRPLPHEQAFRGRGNPVNYANWFGCLIGAATGATRMTPIAAGTKAGPFVAEALVMALLVTTGLTALVAAGLSVWGLREKALRASPARQRG
jgi:hypothetical protein